MASLFTLTSRLKNAVVLLNDLDSSKLPTILTRVIKKLDLAERPFTEAEETQLLRVFEITSADLNTILEACSFIFEQSAYYSISPSTLGSQLEKTGLQAEHREAFQKVWFEEAQSLIARIKGKSLFPSTLESTGWRLHLHMAQSNLSKIKQPSAIFELNLNNEGAGDKDSKKLMLEFNKDQLKQFYHQLETIQDQLDTLG